jgi:hypothetical protein
MSMGKQDTLTEITFVVTVEIPLEIVVTLLVDEHPSYDGNTEISEARFVGWDINENIGLTAVVDREIKKYDPMDWV